MAKTSDEVLAEVLSTTLKLDAESVTALKEADGSWKDEAIPFIATADANRVTALNQEADRRISEKAGTVKRETMEGFEKTIREEFGVKDAALKGVDLIKHARAALVSTAGTLTEDKVKAHPLYMELQTKVETIPTLTEEAVKAHEAKLRSEFKREANYGIATKRGQTILEGMKPILPKTAEVAANQRALLDQDILQQPLDFVANSSGGMDIIPMTKGADGNLVPLKDSHGHPVSFDQMVKVRASRYFEFQASDEKSAGDDPNKVKGGDAGGGGSYDPKSTTEYATAWQKIDDNGSLKPEQKTAEFALLKAAGVKNGVIPA